MQHRDRIIHPKQTMEFAAGVLALIRRDLTFVEFAGEFCGLASVTELHDAAILHLFRLGANYQRSMDFPDTTGLCWREGIYRCLGSYRSRVETNPRVSPLAPPTLLRLRWSCPALLRWSCPARLRLCWFPSAAACPRFPSAAASFPSAATSQCLLRDCALQCLLRDCSLLQCRLLASLLQCRLLASLLQCRLLASLLQCRLLASLLQCRLLASLLQCRLRLSLQSPCRFSPALQSPCRFRSAL